MSDGIAYSYSEAMPRQTTRGVVFYSKFLVSLNTNIKPMGVDHQIFLERKLRNLIDENFQGPNILANIKILNDPDADTDTKEQLIEKVNVTFSLEIGKKARGGRLHAHVIVDIRHRTKIHINADRLRDMLLIYFGHKGHVDVKYFPSAEILQDYISKDIIF